MAFFRAKVLCLGVALYVVLGSAGGPLSMPCYADPIAQAELDPEDVEDRLPGGFTQFRVVFVRGFTTKYATEGQSVVARLMEDLVIDDAVLAPKGSLIYGRVESLMRGRSILKSATSDQRRFKAHAQVTLRFDKVVTPHKAKIELHGEAAPQYSVFSNGETVRTVSIGPSGELIRVDDTDMAGLPELGLILPKSWFKIKDRHEIELKPGDQIVVQVDTNKQRDVSGKVVLNKEPQPH